MEEVSFNCQTSELLHKIEHLRSLVKPRSAKARRETLLEIRIQPNFVSFCIPGLEVKQFCSTKGWASYTFSLEYFYMILNDYTGLIFTPKFIDGEMHVGGLFTKGLGYNMETTHPENKLTIDIPLNYSPVDILNLKDKLDPNSIGIAGVYSLIANEEQKLIKNIGIAYKALSSYGFSRDEISQFVRNKIIK
ncbi:MAG TPA: hypothetical protein PLI47_10060 [Bacteroidia bacterium]|nr:hypothetical protein [Bacteroidia bacterium]